LLVLPWIPASTPAAFLIWSGPLALLVWAAITLSFVASAIEATRVEPSRWLGRVVGALPVWSAGALACAIYAVAAWQVAPSRPEGDEPHYLIITQSLLKDGDLRIENNHRNGDYRAFYRGEVLRPDYRRAGRNGEIYSIHAPG